MTSNGHHLKRRDFLRTAGGGSLALLALNWPSWAVAAEAGEKPELSLDGAGLAFRGGQPQVTLLLGAGAAPVVLTPLESVVVKESKRETPAGPASARTFAWSDPRGFQFSWTVSRLEKRPGVTVQMHFTNSSKQPVRLRDFGLLKTDAAGFSVEGKLADWFLSTLDSHDSVEGGFHPSATLAPARAMENSASSAAGRSRWRLWKAARQI
ncbi:MAG: hypothetical protein KDN05_06535 [Verrucomicrobiae bacterium]|nr:hypothetical protein [Verrucomicrobiae bacterium]